MACWSGRRAWGYNRVWRHPMRTITIEVPDHLPPEIAASTENLASAFRLAAAIFWYDRGLISQGKGAEIAGLTRAGFLKALSDAKVDALQVTPEELKAELERTLGARR
jgi:predicted HTH domain antitoxin